MKKKVLFSTILKSSYKKVLKQIGPLPPQIDKKDVVYDNTVTTQDWLNTLSKMR